MEQCAIKTERAFGSKLPGQLMQQCDCIYQMEHTSRVCFFKESHGESEDDDGVATRLAPRDYGLLKTLQLRQCL